MSYVKKRSSHNLLHAAKKMISASEEVINTSHNLKIRISKYKRERRIPDYVKLSAKEFMAWWITSTGAKLKASNMLLSNAVFRGWIVHFKKYNRRFLGNYGQHSQRTYKSSGNEGHRSLLW